MANYTAYSLDFSAEEFNKATSIYLNSITDLFSTTTDYVVDDFVIYDGALYQCITDCAAGEWTPACWEEKIIFSNDDFDIMDAGGAEL